MVVGAMNRSCFESIIRMLKKKSFDSLMVQFNIADVLDEWYVCPLGIVAINVKNHLNHCNCIHAFYAYILLIDSVNFSQYHKIKLFHHLQKIKTYLTILWH